jgi:hypothetical protein
MIQSPDAAVAVIVRSARPIALARQGRRVPVIQ